VKVVKKLHGQIYELHEMINKNGDKD